MVKIITDTTSCLSAEFSRRYGVPIIPQIVSFGEESFYEGSQIDQATFLARLKTSPVLPKTSAPPPDLFTHAFERLVPLGEPILCIHPSTEVSGTVRSAQVAAKDFPDADIRVIDTRLIGSPIASMVELAAVWAQDGLDIDTIHARLNDMIPRGRIYFLVATLEYLQKGGRIGGAAALVGSLLQIKPILAIQDGRVEQYEKERTHKRAIARLVEIVAEQYPRQTNGYLSIMHAGVPEQGTALAQQLSDLLKIEQIPIFDVPPAIVTHGGPGILAVSFFV
jgi:DegV family protein with EDD domain